tara:strand:+ start:3310 stop:3702 length:393 start_codon:yes stop_codon:yes gene_type:complete
MKIDIEEVKLQAGRQYCHNNGEGFVIGYDKRIIDKALEQQQAEIKQLKKDNEWFSVDDRLPDEEIEVIVSYDINGYGHKDDYRTCPAFIKDSKWFALWVCHASIQEGEYHEIHMPVKDWKPLPKPPEGQS